MKILFSGSTNIGKKRERNEDYFKIVPEKNLVVLCDGMGGLDSGDVASKVAVKTICELHSTKIEKKILQTYSDLNQDLPEEINRIIGLIRLANQRIFSFSLLSRGANGQMGTTIEVVHFSKNCIFIGHVGDSRVYRLRNNNLEQLTHDHSWINELIEDNEITESDAASYRIRNVITRALGIKPSIKIDIISENILPEDLYLICTDGLTGPVNDELIKKILIDKKYDSLNDKNEKLIATANTNGGPDNITVALAKVESLQALENIIPNIRTVISEVEENIQEKENRLLDEIYGKINKSARRLNRRYHLILGAAIFFLVLTLLKLSFMKFFNGNTINSNLDIKEQSTPDVSLQKKGKIWFNPLEIDYYEADIYLDGIPTGKKVKECSNRPLEIEEGHYMLSVIFNSETLYQQMHDISSSREITITLE